MRRRICSYSLIDFQVMANSCMQQVMQPGAAASVIRTPLAIALLMAVVTPVRPALADNFFYVQNANGQEYFYHTTPCCLASANGPNNNNWSQEKHTFFDAVGDEIVSARGNWYVDIDDNPYGSDYYPGSPNDPTAAAERDVFLDSVTVRGDVNATLYTLNISDGGILDIIEDKSLTIISALNISSDNIGPQSILNMVRARASLTLGNNLAFVPLAISSRSILNMAADTSLTIMHGNIENYGTINLQAGASSVTFADLKIANDMKLIGSGHLVLNGDVNNRIYGVTGSEELINDFDDLFSHYHTISGGGRLGDNRLKLINEGLIDANIAATTLYVNPNASGATNTRIMQASEGGILRLQDGTFTNTVDGVIQALDGSQVQLGEGATVVGGTLSSSGSGKIVVPDNTFAGLSGTVTHNGLISLEVSSNSARFSDLKIADGTTLTGTGRVVLGGRLNNRIYGVTTGNEELINRATLSDFHTISGGGRLGDNRLKLTNQGLIDANIAATTLYVNPSASGATNTGIMQACGGGIFRLQDGTFTNTEGVIQALDGSQVQLGEGATVVGGTLSSSGSGKIVVPDDTFAGLSGTITNNGLVSLEVSSNSAASLT